MKCPTSVTLNFDPKLASDSLFKDKISLIIWCCIVFNHARNQYFNQRIKDFVTLIKFAKPETYQDFKICISTSALNQYGRDCIDEGNFIRMPQYELSDEFWMQVWRYIKKQLLGESIQLDLFPDDQELEIKVGI